MRGTFIQHDAPMYFVCVIETRRQIDLVNHGTGFAQTSQVRSKAAALIFVGQMPDRKRTPTSRGARFNATICGLMVQRECARCATSSAASSTLRANTPGWSSVVLNGRMPSVDSTPSPGLYPTTPQKAAGRITEPFVWVPMAAGTNPAATAAADPLEDPPWCVCVVPGVVRLGGRHEENKLRSHRFAKMNAPAVVRRSTTSALCSGMFPS